MSGQDQNSAEEKKRALEYWHEKHGDIRHSKAVVDFVWALRSARASKGLTQTELAELVGCKQSMIAKVETLRRLPSLALVYRIAEVLDINPGDLVDGKRKQKRGLR